MQNSPPTQDDPVNHPIHYTSHPSGIECIQITEHMNFCLGNAIKYIWRADEKNGVEDLQKAIWYIAREIQRRQPGYEEFPDVDKTLGVTKVYVSKQRVELYNRMRTALQALGEDGDIRAHELVGDIIHLAQNTDEWTIDDE